MISASQIKYIKSLAVKKYRQKYNAFVAEGDKIVKEILISTLPIINIYALPEWIAKNGKNLINHHAIIHSVSQTELKKISNLSTPNNVLIICKIPEVKVDKNILQTNFSIILDNIQDPGNMGTIIRIADWFNIPYIFCSEDCVDVYNQKVVQSTMGSIGRVGIIYTDLETIFKKYTEIPIYGAVLNGISIHQTKFSKSGFLIIGSESTGISKQLIPFIQHFITIPKFGQAESLNAAISCGIIIGSLKK